MVNMPYEFEAMMNRISMLEKEVRFLYGRLEIPYERASEDQPVIELIMAGKDKEAIAMYRQIHSCGLAQANDGVKQLKQDTGF